MKEKFRQPEQAIRLFFWLFAAACLLAAIAMPDRGQMVEGMLRLCTLPYQSANSYFDAANGGFAGTFLNAAIVCAVCAAIYSLPGSKPDGVSVLAYFLTAGFCFWGITVLNIWFCFAGVLIGCLIRKVKFYTQGNVFLFSTGIAPLMTDLLIRYPGAESRGVTLFGAVLTLLVCTVIGLILPAGLAHSPKVHKGYDLYSAAVPVGLTAFFLRAVLYRVLGGTLPDGVGVGAGDGNWAVCNIFCIAVFVLALVLGLGLGGSFRQYGELLKDSGFGADYGRKIRHRDGHFEFLQSMVCSSCSTITSSAQSGMRRRSAAYSAWSAAASREAIRQTSGRLWRATWRRHFSQRRSARRSVRISQPPSMRRPLSSASALQTV